MSAPEPNRLYGGEDGCQSLGGKTPLEQRVPAGRECRQDLWPHRGQANFGPIRLSGFGFEEGFSVVAAKQEREAVQVAAQLVAEAYTYGSWAARYLGEPEPTPVGVDVLVVSADPARRRLRREVNIRRVQPTVWKRPGNDSILASVEERPLVRVVPAAKEERGD